MKKPRKIYKNEKWFEFSSKVKNRDGYKCLQCQRGDSEVVLQVHHEKYIEGIAPWDYALSDCRTLCKGCHAQQHNLIEPNKGWRLTSIDDLGGEDGICESKNCGKAIRYAHLIYHPSWGYQVVGSTCVEHLTQEDQLLSSDIIKFYKNISEFVHESDWKKGITKNRKEFLTATYKHHAIRIYGEENKYAYQLVLKEKGVRWHDYKDIKTLHGKTLIEVKELSYIALRGTIAKEENEKSVLRGIYKQILRSHIKAEVKNELI